MISEGRRPGCDDERLRPFKLNPAIVPDGREDGDEVSGDVDPLYEDGAEVLIRLWEIEPITGEALINGAWLLLDVVA